MTLAYMMEEALHLSGRSLTFQQMRGALWELFAVRPSRRALRLAAFGDAALKRDGSSAFRLDEDLRVDRLVREIFGVEAA